MWAAVRKTSQQVLKIHHPSSCVIIDTTQSPRKVSCLSYMIVLDAAHLIVVFCRVDFEYLMRCFNILVIWHRWSPFSTLLYSFPSGLYPIHALLQPLQCPCTFCIYVCVHTCIFSAMQKGREEDECVETTDRRVHIEKRNHFASHGSCPVCGGAHFQGERPAIAHGTDADDP